MGWRLAKSLDRLRRQINTAAPDRSRISDGTIGDTAHSARKSDHNPDDNGVVCALDITHDPANGVDSEALAQSLITSHDYRIKYVISNGRIAAGNQGPLPWEWRKYTGSNPHSRHVHISVLGSLEHDDRDWVFSVEPPVGSKQPSDRPSLLLRGARGVEVKALQRMLRVTADGIFGPITEAAVKYFQKANGLVVDGKVGPYTWDALYTPREVK